MQSSLLAAVEDIKSKIKEHNQNNATSRRNYSEDIKKSVIELCNKFQLSSGKIGKLIGVSDILVSKWKRNGPSSKKAKFRPVSVAQGQKQKIIIKHTAGFYLETDFEFLDLILLKTKSL